MDMDNPALAFFFVLFVFLAPLVLVAAPFLFLCMIAAVAGAEAGEAGSTSRVRGNPGRSSGFHVVGYVRVVSNCRREDSIISWKLHIQPDGNPVKMKRTPCRCIWVASGPARRWRRLALMEASTTNPGCSDTNSGNA
jgi:hypothetical protein